MQEQIQIRDNLINLAVKHFADHEVDIDLNDSKLVNIEEIIKINSSLPPISTPYSSLKGNSDIERSNVYGVHNSKTKPKNRLVGNSLPPVPVNREQTGNSNYYSNKRNFFIGKQYSNANPYGGPTNRIANGLVSLNNRINRKSHANVNSFHSQMKKNQHTYSTPSLKPKKRYGYKVNTAKVREPQSDSQMENPLISRPNILPKTGHRRDMNNYNRHLQSPEERKRSGSVVSSSSIISTASSNSPGGKKAMNSINNLQIAGQPLTIRKENQRFSRSPFVRNNNLRNYVQKRDNNHNQAKAALQLLNKKKYL